MAREQAATGYRFTASVGNVADWDRSTAASSASGRMRTDRHPLNNAGITRDGIFRKMTLARLADGDRHQLNSLFKRTKQVIDGNGSTQLGSHHQHLWSRREGPVRQSNYSAAKAGMHGFTMSLALEVANKGITVNTVFARSSPPTW